MALTDTQKTTIKTRFENGEGIRVIVTDYAGETLASIHAVLVEKLTQAGVTDVRNCMRDIRSLVKDRGFDISGLTAAQKAAMKAILDDRSGLL